MTDSPFYKAPTDEHEQPILDKLLVLRDKLLLLKQDRSQYIKSQDVVAYYDELIEHVHTINDLRTNKRDEQNRCALPSFQYLARINFRAHRVG